MNIFGYEDFVNILFFFFFFLGGGGGGVITILDYIFGAISMHFRVFFYGQCTEWGIFFFVAKI